MWLYFTEHKLHPIKVILETDLILSRHKITCRGLQSHRVGHADGAPPVSEDERGASGILGSGGSQESALSTSHDLGKVTFLLPVLGTHICTI